MSYDIRVSTGDVADKATAIQREAADLETRLAALTSAMTELAGTWTGPASAAFQNVYENWKGTAHQTRQALEELGASLRNAGTHYDDTETALRSQWT